MTIDVVVNGVREAIDPTTTVEVLVARLGAPATGVAVARNGEVVPRSEWPRTSLGPDDRIEIIAPTSGG